MCGAALPAGASGSKCPACSVPRSTPAHTTVVMSPGGTISNSTLIDPPDLPNIEIIGVIGQGGMGAVFKARQIHLDRIVAVKVVRLDFHGEAGVEERFEREARALARLNHPNIVTVHDFGRSSDQHYLIMEFVDGVTLRDAMQTNTVTEEQGMQIVASICDALAYAHSTGIVHRDLKPENILIDHFGRVKIADFGLARLVSERQPDRRLTTTGQIMGTLHYMAPEQVERPTEVDHRADIYALGVIFYELLTRELPLGRFPLPSQVRHSDVRLDQVVLKALEKEPLKRFQSALEIRTIVDEVRSTPSPAGPPALPHAFQSPESGPVIKLELDRAKPGAAPPADTPSPKRTVAGPFKVPEAGQPSSDAPIRNLSDFIRSVAYALLGIAFITLWTGLTLGVFGYMVPLFVASLLAGTVCFGHASRIVRRYISRKDGAFAKYARGLLKRAGAYANVGLILTVIAAILFPLAGPVPAWAVANVAVPFWAIAGALAFVHGRIRKTVEPKLLR